MSAAATARPAPHAAPHPPSRQGVLAPPAQLDARRVVEIGQRIAAQLRHRANNGSRCDIKVQLSQAEARALLARIDGRAP